MIMDTRKHLAAEKKRCNSHNCAQAVVCTYCDLVGLATRDRNLSRARMKQMMAKFQERNGATRCKLLKGAGTGKPLRDCPDCVADASEFLEEVL